MTADPIDEQVKPQAGGPPPSAEQAGALEPSAADGQAATAAPAAAGAAPATAGAAEAPAMESPGITDVAQAAEAATVVAGAPAVPRPSRRPMVLAALKRIGIVAFTLVLFGGGVLLGATTFQRTRPIPAGSEQAVAVTDPPPIVTQEFVAALAANDADAIRSALKEQPNKDLTGEFKRFDIKDVKGVDTLGTFVDGARSATEILLHVEGSDGHAFEVNLVILVDGGTIEGFR